MTMLTHILALCAGLGLGSIIGFLAFRYAQRIEDDAS